MRHDGTRRTPAGAGDADNPEAGTCGPERTPWNLSAGHRSGPRPQGAARGPPRRGALFLYDETTRELLDACFDNHVGPLPPDLVNLRPPSALVDWPHPVGAFVITWMRGG